MVVVRSRGLHPWLLTDAPSGLAVCSGLARCGPNGATVRRGCKPLELKPLELKSLAPITRVLPIRGDAFARLVFDVLQQQFDGEVVQVHCLNWLTFGIESTLRTMPFGYV